MTKWEKLLGQLDQVFGFQNRKKSSVKKRKQLYDDQVHYARTTLARSYPLASKPRLMELDPGTMCGPAELPVGAENRRLGKHRVFESFLPSLAPASRRGSRSDHRLPRASS